ncbi:MAG: ATP-binding protein [Verrucomicrobiia bacterium]
MEITLILSLTATALAAVVLYRKVIQPAWRVRELASNLAAGRPRGGYIPTGWFGLDQVIRDLERLDDRIANLEKHASADKFNLQATMANMVEGFIVVDRTLQIQQANDALLRMFAITADPVGKPMRAVLRHAGVQHLIESAMLEGRQISREIELEEVGETTQPRSFEVNASPLFDIVQRVTGAVVVFHDISKIRQLEDVRREFVANVSHELRTPLSIFRGYLETIENTPDLEPTELRRILAVMHRHSDRLNSLVEDLLLLARLESKRLPMEPEQIHLSTFFHDLTADWERMVRQKGCRLRVELASTLDSIEADRLRLEQVLINLLENALKYSNPGGEIRLGAKHGHEQGTVLFWVGDDGIGIPRDKLTHVFERFYRVDKARSRDQGGTGLGLSIVKHIVQAHGGRVWAESTPGCGTTISFLLPRTMTGLSDEFMPDGETKKIPLSGLST